MRAPVFREFEGKLPPEVANDARADRPPPLPRYAGCLPHPDPLPQGGRGGQESGAGTADFKALSTRLLP